MKLHFLVSLAALASSSLSSPASAYDWGPNGVPIAGGVFDQDAQKIIADGIGGAYIVWRDNRHPSLTSSDVFLQRITAAGQVAPGWPLDGLPICTEPSEQEVTDIASDGQGGALVVWEDLRGPGTSFDIYAQHVLPNGLLAPGWPVDGARVSCDLGYEIDPVIESDGAGGAYVGWANWTDYGFVPTAFAQHLGADGVPALGWSEIGRRLSSIPSQVIAVIADGGDGAVFTWGQVRGDSSDVYAVKMTSSGEIANGWPPGGSPIALGCGGRGAISDGAGGFFTVCALVNLQGGTEHGYELHRWTFAGQRVPGWPDAGLRFGVAPGNRVLSPPSADGFGGVLLGWFDYRNPNGGSDVYATRVLPDASFAPGWQQDGVLASDPSEGLETNVDIAPDGAGGAFLVWQWDTFTGSPSKIQHLTADGHIAPGWPASGVRIAQTSSQFDPTVAPDGAGGAIVAWTRTSLFAQHFSMEPPVPTLPAMTSVEATPEAVILVWTGSKAGDWNANVYHRTVQSEWKLLGPPQIDGSGGLRYEDRSVVAGERYAYRLGLRDGEQEIFTTETWVDVPSELRLALEGFRPNPARGILHAAFTLANPAPARLEVIDVAGRIVASREVGPLGPGRHLIDASDGNGVSAGVYWLRLTQGSESLTARGVVIR